MPMLDLVLEAGLVALGLVQVVLEVVLSEATVVLEVSGGPEVSAVVSVVATPMPMLMQTQMPMPMPELVVVVAVLGVDIQVLRKKLN